MKKLISISILLCLFHSPSEAQYKGKYVGWSIGYIFRGTLTSIVWKAYTHVVNFQVTVSAAGALSTNSLASPHAAFIAACHQNGAKALVCVGGAGQSKNFSAACSSPATQSKLVSNIINLVKTQGYDGVDMDWEPAEESDDAAMVAKYKSLHKELRDSLDLMSPRPMLTVAVSTSWYPNCTASIAPYADQMNNMSYYSYVKDMPADFKPVLDKGVAKSELSVGFGFDTDNEITDINDIVAKCKYSIDNGFGGIMVWDINRAPAATSDSIANYVTHNATTGISRVRIGFVNRNRMSGITTVGNVQDHGAYGINERRNGARRETWIIDAKGIVLANP